MTFAVTSKPFEISSDNVLTHLRRITREGEPAENVEFAWRIFREAELHHLGSLRADIPRLPPQTVPIIAAAVARLEGRDPAQELERRRNRSGYTEARCAADTLGRYLADPQLSGAEFAQENLLKALGHKERRVRLAALAELKRREDPKAAEYLLNQVLAEYPLNSPRTARRRGIGIALVRGLAWAPLFAGSYLSRDIGIVLAVVGFAVSTALVTFLEIWLLKGADRLSLEARTDILQWIADDATIQPTAMADKIPELRALGTGLELIRDSKRAARRVVERIETASKGLKDLPVAAAAAKPTPSALPIPVSVDE